MPLLDTGLKAIFGAAFGGLYLAATLHKVTPADSGSGGYLAPTTDYPILALVEQLQDRARAASGLPDPAVSISVLQANVPVAIDLDDLLTVSGATFRVIRRDEDPAGAAWSLLAVPV
jgi:hypothetical protein